MGREKDDKKGGDTMIISTFTLINLINQAIADTEETLMDIEYPSIAYDYFNNRIDTLKMVLRWINEEK